MSLRKKGKDERRERIFRAAAEAFASYGYERTTIREIARVAGVATGTVFLYAEDKQALLAMVYTAEVTAVGGSARTLLEGEGPAMSRLVRYFGEYYRYYARHEDLSRVFLKELMFTSRKVPLLRGATGAFLGEIREVIVKAQEAGEIRCDVDPGRAAAVLFGTYWTCLMAWLGGALPSVDAAISELGKGLELVFVGLCQNAHTTRTI